MKNRLTRTYGQRKRDSATRSAGKQATGNRNKHLLAAERRRTDEPHGRLNKQNPVSPQNSEPHKSKDGTKQNAGIVEISIKRIEKTIDKVYEIRKQAFKEGKLNYEAMLYEVEMALCRMASKEIQEV